MPTRLWPTTSVRTTVVTTWWIMIQRLVRCAKKQTAQGYADESSWARGQAWALYGYTMCYRYTHDAKYLAQAEKVYNFIFGNKNLPEDLVPYWDFDAPKIPNEPRDASAAACTASALYELSTYVTDKGYKETADRIMESLASPAYRAEVGTNGNFILMHSVGSIPHGAEIDVPLNYADYYYEEALIRKRNIENNQPFSFVNDKTINNNSHEHLPYSLIGGIGLLSLQSCASKQQVAEQEYPNVIYVFPDQYRNMAMGFWHENGFKEHINFAADPVHTPHIDKFAKESLVLSSAMSNCPLSSPHRGSLLTGMYPNKSGIPLNCNSTRPISSLRTDVECVSDVFSKNGYDCAYFGKLHADFPTPNDPENPGEYVETKRPVWDAYTPKERRHGFNYWYSYGTFDEHKNPHYWDTDGKRHDPKEWSPLHEAKQVISYLRNDKNQRDPKKSVLYHGRHESPS